MSRTFLLLRPADSCNASLSERQGNPHFLATGSGTFAAARWIQRSCGFRKANEYELFSTGDGRCSLDAGLVLLKDRMQDFFMGVGSWEMANGRWHIDQ